MMRRTLHSGRAAVVGLLAVLLTAGTARASFIETVVQSGSNVVVTGSGSIPTAPGPAFETVDPASSFIDADISAILTGASGKVDVYAGITGPTSFGLGSFRDADSASGDLVGAEGDVLFLPEGYVFGTALSHMAIYDNQTFATLGLTPGAYTWTWGDGIVGDSFTLQIDAAAVPEPTALAMFLTMLGLGWVTVAVSRRSRRHSDSRVA